MLLMPASLMKRLATVSTVTIRDLEEIARRLRVGRRALLNHLMNLGFIDEMNRQLLEVRLAPLSEASSSATVQGRLHTSLAEDPATEAGEEKTTRDVVGRAIRQRGHDPGNSRNCGDWLAQELDGPFTNEKGKFDHELFTRVLELNGVELEGRWANLPSSGQNGWIGRYRMNGRRKLERRIAKTGVLVLFVDHKCEETVEIAPPEDWLRFTRGKLRM